MVKRINLTVLFLFFVVTSICSATTSIENAKKDHPFAKLFTTDLYQLDVVNEYDIPPAPAVTQLAQGQKHQDLSSVAKLDRLQTRKYNHVMKKLILPMEQDLATLSEFDWRQLLKIGLRASATAGTSAVTTAMLYPKTDPITFDVALKAAGITFCLHLVTEGIILYYLEDENGKAARIDINFLRTKLLEDIEKEDVKTLEEKYIGQQNQYVDWQDIIEKLFLKARKEQGNASKSLSIDKLTDILNFPLQTLYLPPQYNVTTDIERKKFGLKVNAFMDQLFTAPTLDKTQRSLSYYAPEVQKALKAAMIKICRSSNAERHPDLICAKRRFIVFYGEPGGGKTVAAKLMVKKLGLPLYPLKLTSIKALEKKSLCGSGASYNAQKGTYPSAFLTPHANGQKYKNIFIHIDDIDRVFKKDEQTGELEDKDSFMGALLELFDLEHSTIEAAYYGIPDLDISQVHFICTTNTDFKAMHDEVKGQKRFKAFNDRVEIIKFIPPTKEQKKENIKHLIHPATFDLSLCYANTSTAERDILRQNLADFIVDNFDPSSNRMINQMIEECLDSEQAEWNDLAKEKDWAIIQADEDEDEDGGAEGGIEDL